MTGKCRTELLEKINIAPVILFLETVEQIKICLLSLPLNSPGHVYCRELSFSIKRQKVTFLQWNWKKLTILHFHVH